MTAVGISVVICVIVYLVIAFNVLKSNETNKKDTIIRITAPTTKEIEKEQQLKVLASPIYPDSLFERLCFYILRDDPNPRKVVKLMQEGFSDAERELLLQCLSINNPILHNEVLSLQHCDSSKFEEYEDKEIRIKSESQSLTIDNIEEEPSGIPADFFITAMELNPDSQTINHINLVYERLSPEEEEIIMRQCQRIRLKRKREEAIKETVCPIDDILTKATEETELFMQLFKEKLQEEEEQQQEI